MITVRCGTGSTIRRPGNAPLFVKIKNTLEDAIAFEFRIDAEPFGVFGTIEDRSYEFTMMAISDSKKILRVKTTTGEEFQFIGPSFGNLLRLDGADFPRFSAEVPEIEDAGRTASPLLRFTTHDLGSSPETSGVFHAGAAGSDDEGSFRFVDFQIDEDFLNGVLDASVPLQETDDKACLVIDHYVLYDAELVIDLYAERFVINLSAPTQDCPLTQVTVNIPPSRPPKQYRQFVKGLKRIATKAPTWQLNDQRSP
jgi:hypothetical protein